jgi:branched-chain amino acid transport system ATP-binding protein
MLNVIKISSGYDKTLVIKDVSFDIGDNEFVLLTGANGSGKSTVLKCIYNLLPKFNNDAKIIYNSKDITSLFTFEMVREGIVYIPQDKNYYESLSVYENLIISGSTGNYSRKEIDERIEDVYDLTRLKELHKRTPFNLSGGERKLLALGNALMHKPSLILFDEPLAGLDNQNSANIIKELLNLKQRGIGMLIVEHNKTIKDLYDKEITLKLGRII